jgi:hypothetical protein
MIEEFLWISLHLGITVMYVMVRWAEVTEDKFLSIYLDQWDSKI